jgi:hypothetical protein
MRAAAGQAGNPDMIALWAGQAVTLSQAGDAESLVKRWWQEARETARALAARTGVA